ncbi:hypothetical protein KP509_19G065100 [Ceratopteris richardii]|uniref:Uncharacterized protein n=1 Tax=Ceratopteris richardii TaxID=49495 RepID=A0A8T2SL58_CERRI|nr:hypothetical protein KP509_19G065100 [Ceratopteris richardii]
MDNNMNIYTDVSALISLQVNEKEKRIQPIRRRFSFANPKTTFDSKDVDKSSSDVHRRTVKAHVTIKRATRWMMRALNFCGRSVMSSSAVIHTRHRRNVPIVCAIAQLIASL